MSIVTTTEIIVASVGTLGTGAIGKGIHWFANQVIEQGKTSQEILSEVRGLKHAIYGNPESKVADGLQVTVSATMTAVEALDGRVNEIDGRLKSVERGCVAQHGEFFFRGEPRTNE